VDRRPDRGGRRDRLGATARPQRSVSRHRRRPGPRSRPLRAGLRGFPDAVIEDPALTDETRDLLEANAERISWDAPITGVESIEALPFEPAWLNVKPSRFGTLASPFETIAYCQDEGIGIYGGGQFELGVGRDGIRALASLLYPERPNEVAPGGYNDPELPEGLPDSPLAPAEDPSGLDW
jgi:hypothetical protein